VAVTRALPYNKRNQVQLSPPCFKTIILSASYALADSTAVDVDLRLLLLPPHPCRRAGARAAGTGAGTTAALLRQIAVPRDQMADLKAVDRKLLPTLRVGEGVWGGGIWEGLAARDRADRWPGGQGCLLLVFPPLMIICADAALHGLTD
jgi:hypothetical protein